MVEESEEGGGDVGGLSGSGPKWIIGRMDCG